MLTLIVMEMLMQMKKKILFFIVFVCVFCSGFLWFFLFSKPYFYCLNTQFTASSVPTTKIKIDDKECLVEIDIGSKLPLILSKKTLANISKKEKKEKMEWRDFKGNKYTANTYVLHKVAIGNIFFNNVIANEINEDYSKNTSILSYSNREVQSIGRPLFEKFKILFDCKSNKLFISNDLKKLKKKGYDISTFIRVPCKWGRTGLILEVETDLGKKRLSIDTGFTISSLRSSSEIKNTGKKYTLPIFTTRKFVIGDKDFGVFDLFLLNITSELNELDGTLGMDFIKSHVMYIDFPAKIVYISKE